MSALDEPRAYQTNALTANFKEYSTSRNVRMRMSAEGDVSVRRLPCRRDKRKAYAALSRLSAAPPTYTGATVPYVDIIK